MGRYIDMDRGGIMEPDYFNYSLEELYDVQQNIDAEKYPERHVKIAMAIESKLNDPIEVGVHETTKHEYRIWAALLVSCTAWGWAFNALYTGSFRLRRSSVYYSESPDFFIGLVIVFFIIGAFSLYEFKNQYNKPLKQDK
jgi:hypothetical protein